MINKKNIFFAGILLFLIGFVWATAASSPINVIFNSNASADYDEGSFFVNWTNASVDTGYRIYIWMNDVLVNTTAVNTSATGLPYINTTEANYTFTIEALNDTEGFSANATNVSMYIDTTVPVIALPNWDNSTLRRNNQDITLNVSVSDILSNLTSSVCLVDVNGTNQSISVSSGWCNSTAISLSGLTDGNHTIDVHVNDTVNNLGVNGSYSVQIDTTSPSPTSLTLSSSTTNSLSISFSGSDGTCTASGSGTKSISGSTLTVTGLGGCGTAYAYTITCTDTAGNSGVSSSTSFLTTGCGGGTSNNDSSPWTNTFVVSNEQFIEGFTTELQKNHRMKLSVNNEDHYVGVIELTTTTAKIDVASEHQQATLSIGDSRKFELTGDEIYDLLVTLNSISSNKASITILSISEEITEESIVEEEAKEEAASGDEESGVTPEKVNLTWLWIAIIVIVVAGILYFFKRQKK